ncbi:pyridoxamine 5'-phosphate oxidase family protein [Halobellus rufus]|uniref:pyridoxamine 5'-phosphate oxidase family protein n=1 Tax=Halobellus rufus TaxID=1448860 RepID=UPI0009DCE2D8|nr:pyridoxamine 5'-phosphate oxidase family protein [Halobellus rufus]
MTADLTRDEIDTLLRESGSGVLALTDGEEAYSIPESFGYDGNRLYFQFASTADSKKMDFLETTETATLTVYSEEPAKSVLVQGAVDPVPDDEEIRATTSIAENASIPTLNVYPETALQDLTMDYYQLTPDTITGRSFNAFTPASTKR